MSKRLHDERLADDSTQPTKRKKLLMLAAFSAVVMLTIGVFAKNGWFPSGPDPFTGKRTGWFGAPVAKGAGTSWNPLAAPLPAPTPQLSREYINAGSRLLAVVDANAQETPPADLAVWRKSDGTWYVINGVTSQQTQYTWGTCTPTCDIPVQGDFDGDGKTDFSVFRPSAGEWWITKSSDGSYYGVTYGQSGDIPAPADYDGDGKTDLSFWRPSTQVWYVIPSSTGAATSFGYGASGDVPVPADYS